MTPEKLMVVAGEKSGDLHASRIIASLKQLSPSMQIFGVGGENMARSGAEILIDITGLAVTGFAEVLKSYFKFRRLFHFLVETARQRKPDAVLLVDYPGFNLKLAAAMKSLGITVVYFVSPQVWAWGRGRLRKMRKFIDRMIVVFDFEVPFYEQAGIDVTFVGHPLADALAPTMSRREFRRKIGIPDDAGVVALLPGSRLNEVSRHVPIMAEAAELIWRKRNGTQFLLPAASRELAEECQRLLRKHGVSAPIRILDDSVYDAISASDAAIVSSGTATLETGCLGTPLVVIYKVSPLTYLIARRLVTISNIGLINIVAGKTIAPEFIQNQARPERIAERIVEFLTDAALRETVSRQLAGARAKLGPPGASQRAAEVILNVLQQAS
jgi:lipid-A-disaccharide synthase